MNPNPSDQTRWLAEQVQPHEPMLRAYLQKEFPRLHDIDDVVQESYLRLLHAQKTRPIGSVRAYFFSTARNITISLFRRKRFTSEISVNDIPASKLSPAPSDVSETVNANQEFDLAVEAIAALPDRCREIMILRTLRGMPHKLIAQQLGISEKTVRVQVVRGMRKCAEFLRARGVQARAAG